MREIHYLFTHLWVNLRTKRRVQFSLLIVLMLIVSLFESVSLGLVLPFLIALTNPSQILKNQHLPSVMNDIASSLGEGELLRMLTIAFLGATISAGIFRYMMMFFLTKFSYVTGCELRVLIFEKCLYQPYEIQCGRNSAAIISTINAKAVTLITGLLEPLLTMVSATFILAGALITLFFLNAYTAVIILAIFASFYCSIILFTKKMILKRSNELTEKSDSSMKILQEGLGGGRDILLEGCQNIYIKDYRKNLMIFSRAASYIAILANSPKYVIETVAISLIVVVAYISQKENYGYATTLIPLLGLVAISAQRLLPIVQQAYAALIAIKGNASSARDALFLLEQELLKKNDELNESLKFNFSIELRHISFKYSGFSNVVLKDINLIISKGEVVGIVGPTGGGKSTLLDLIMALLLPSSGEILVDGVRVDIDNYRSWQRKISHVPQTIYLVDDSIASNIAFGVSLEKINYEKVRDAARIAQIDEDIQQMPLKYQTLVGERGVRLSGGQRQRIGIARAIYKGAEILILDEATSALDSETEIKLLRAIREHNKNSTILMVAHRLDTLKGCNKIFRVEGNHISLLGNQFEAIKL